MSALPLLFAETQFAPLFGNQWLALLAVLAGVAVFMVVVALVGRWLAATHPDAPAARPATAAPAAAAPVGTPPEVVAVIAAAVASQLGRHAQITAITPAQIAPNVEMLMAQWSLEGRRQIYSSHQVR